jgi:hypothetical protein
VIAQSGLSSYEQQRAIAAPNPCHWIRGGHKCRDLLLRKKLDWSMLASFGWDRKNSLALKAPCRLSDRHEPKECVDCGEPGVACAYRVSPVRLKMVKKLLDEGPIKFVQRQFGRCPAKILCGESEQQSEGVAVACHRCRADALLFEQTLCKETLQQ